MDSIEPILPHPSILPEVQAAHRSGRVHRDGHQGGGAGRDQRRRRDDDEAVEVDIDGVEDPPQSDTSGPVGLLPPPALHRIDLTADEDPEPPARRIDLTDDDDGDAPAHRIDLSV